jgi:hypothetical protein
MPLGTAMSRVTAPISPGQQRHLAFISEFNVQMLYLPGLQNVVADFLSLPSLPLQSASDVTAAAEALPINFAEMATKQRHCPEMQHLLSGPYPSITFKQAAHSAWSAMFQQVLFSQ